GAVAALGDVAVAGRGTANRRALHVGGARDARAGAVLGEVAEAGGAAALHGGRLQDIGGAVVAGAVAALGDVAVAGRGAADGRALHVGRTGRARAGAVFGQVARAGGGAALDGRRLEPVRRTIVGDAVAALRDVALAGRAAADRSEERRVGKECRSRWTPANEKEKNEV